MSKFTPGPWEVQRMGNSWSVIKLDETPVHIACYLSAPNARLVAAAPDMYEALKALLPYVENDYADFEHEEGLKRDDPDYLRSRYLISMREQIEKAKVALAKAEGK